MLVIVWPFAGVSQPTSVQTSSVLKPTKSVLVPVHLPDLSQLEKDVRDQIISQQEDLIGALKDLGLTDLQLSESFGALGQIYQVYSLNAPAHECYLNASRLAPTEFRWIYLLAKLDQLDGRVDEAIDRYRAAGSLRPEFVAVPVNLGNIYLELNRIEDARLSFAAALEIQKKNPAAFYGLGQVALSKRNYTEAVEYLEKALALVPDANRVHYALAMAYRGLKAPEKAKAHLAQQGTVGVRVADPLVDSLQELVKGARLSLIRGRQALEAKRYSQAAEEFRKAVAERPDSVPAHVNLGAALSQLGDLRGAAEQFEITVQLDPKNIPAHYNLAVLSANQNKHQKAITHLQTVIGLDPTDLNARFFLGRQLTNAMRLDEALAEFSRIVQLAPGNEEALLERVKLLQRNRQYKDALTDLEKAHAQFPQRVQTAVMLAYLLAASPDYELRNGRRALKLAQQTYQLTRSIDDGLVVAMALAEVGRCTEAAEWQRKMIAEVGEARHDLIAKLTADLHRYEKVELCRPAGEASPVDRPK